MASTTSKKFKTKASSKGAGVDVTSESVVLPPDSEDHVLTVTADNSCTGEVDVQLEMSPDGTNWCPAVSRTVSVTAGQSIAARTGNEEYVKLTPDAGEFKNKHCRGGLNFDINGNVVTPDNSGARDLMHQHISVSKSFNYSQWFKTSEAPTTTYKPVLFRHGGYDNFTNSKTVQLTEQDPTSTNIKNTGDTSELSYEWSSFSTNTLKQDQTWTLGFWVDLSDVDPATDVSFGQSLISDGNFGLYTNLYRYGNNSGGVSNRTYLNFQYRFSTAMSANSLYYTQIDLEKLFLVFRSDGSGEFNFDVFDEDGNNIIASTWNKTVVSQTYTGSYWDGQSGVNKCDELFVLDSYVSDANLSTLYQTIDNKIYPEDYSSMSGIQCLYRMEPSAGDTKAQVTSAVDTSGNTFPSTLVNSSFTSSDAIPSLTSSDKLYMQGELKTTQNLCVINKNQYSVKAEDQSYASTTNTITVTVANNGTSNKFYVDGVSSTGLLHLAEGATYIFDQSDSSNSGHPLRFSTTSDGTHGGGSEYTTGVTTNGTPGSAGAYTQIVVASSAPTLYTYCTQHSGMGGEVDTRSVLKRPQLKLSNASGTFINPFKKSTDSNPDTLPDISTTDIANNNDLGITISSNIRFSGPQSGTNYNVKRLWTIYFEDSNGNPKGAIATVISKINSNIYNMFYDADWNQIAYYGTPKGSLLDGNWHHISCNFFKQPAGTSHNQGFYSRMSINGATPPQGSYSTTNTFQDYDGFKITKVVLGGGQDYDIDIEYDNLCFYTGWLNTNSNFTNIYNARKDPLSFSSSNMELKSCFTMGDGADDRSNHIYKDIVEPSSGRQFVKNDSIAAPVSVTLTASDDPYAVLGGNIPSVFDVGVNASISGWFKTTGTGILFSNSSSGTDGLLFDIQSSVYQLKFGSVTTIQAASSGIRDGQWHHLVVTKAAKDGSNLSETKIYIDGSLASTTSVSSSLANSDLRGSNGFTLLGNGEKNATATSPATTDDNKLQASLSNWSLHSEVLNVNAVKQLYSNGHVRNIKNLPDVNTSNIVSWWQLNDATSPEQDLAGSNDLVLSQPILGNQKALQAASNNTSNTRDFISTTASSLFGGTSLPAYNGAWSLSFWVNIPSNGSSFDTIIGEADSLETRKHFKIFQLSGNLTFSMTFVGNAVDLSVPFTTYNTWKHVTITKASGAPSTATVKIYIDGTAQSVSQTYNDDNPVRGTGDNWSTTNDSTITIAGQSWSYNSATTGGTSGSRTGRVFKVDSLAGYSKELSSSEVSYVYNSGNYIDLSTIDSSYNVESYFKFGDYSDDVTTGTIALHDGVGGVGVLGVGDSLNQSIISLTSSDPQFQSGTAVALNTHLVNADGATYVNGSINGNAMTLSLTKSFNFTTNEWVSTANQDTALCLSFNGFEEQAEYFVLWKCSQTVGGGTIDICDGDWHNVILSYRGKNNLSGNNVSEGDTVKFGPGPANSLAFNWAISYDGQPLTSLKDGSGADYIGGLNTLVTDSYSSTTYNVGFAVQNRHIRYETSNTEEEYKPHAQFSAGIHEVSGVDNNNAFQGSVDETSFHSDDWWVDQAGTSIITNTFNQEKPATIYGNTTALNNRQGASTDYPEGKPYDLLHPERLTTSGLAADIEGTNQYINPNRYDSATNPNGGLEGWWRWGDTPGDCSITINDVRDHNDSVNSRDISAFGIVTADRVDMDAQTTPENIYLEDRSASTTSGSASISFPQVVVENIQAGVCNLKDMVSPVLQYLRVKFTGSGSCDLGEGKAQAQINFTKRRKR